MPQLFYGIHEAEKNEVDTPSEGKYFDQLLFDYFDSYRRKIRNEKIKHSVYQKPIKLNSSNLLGNIRGEEF